MLLSGRDKDLGFLEEQLGLPTRSLWYVPGTLKSLPKKTSQSSASSLPAVPLEAPSDDDLAEPEGGNLEVLQADQVQPLSSEVGNHVIADIIKMVGSLLVTTCHGRRLATDKTIAVSRDSCFDAIVREKSLRAYVPRWPIVYIECNTGILEWLVQQLMLDVQNGVNFESSIATGKPLDRPLHSGVLADILLRLGSMTPSRYSVMWLASRHSFGVLCKESGHMDYVRILKYEKYRKMGQEYLDQQLLAAEPQVQRLLASLPGLDPFVQNAC